MQHEAFLSALNNSKKTIWPIVESYLPNPKENQHSAMIYEYPRRKGKYLRPTLLLLSNELHGGNQKDALLPATAIQLSEEWLLIHDDVEDHSEERRSTKDEYRPTLNAIYGDELAINTGDAIHAIMWQVLKNNISSKHQNASEIFDLMQSTIQKTIEGQFFELSWIKNHKVTISVKDYYEMIFRKSALYSIITPLQIGALSAGITNKDNLNAIFSWGQNFGLAFQLWDDVMNITTDSKDQGKEKGGDIFEGKRTLLLLHLLSKCSQIEKDYIISIYLLNRPKKTQKQVDYIISAMNHYGSVEHVKNKAKQYSELSLKEFNNYSKKLTNSTAVEPIRQGIEFVVNRVR
jgi:geranylgeranyl diphosphate synthase, type II